MKNLIITVTLTITLFFTAISNANSMRITELPFAVPDGDLNQNHPASPVSCPSGLVNLLPAAVQDKVGCPNANGFTPVTIVEPSCLMLPIRKLGHGETMVNVEVSVFFPPCERSSRDKAKTFMSSLVKTAQAIRAGITDFRAANVASMNTYDMSITSK